ncbi:hypothetical protein ACSNOI_02565 [Actinomadura kijaniata]|uniref:hypothetical protein n=1 Tax=Actinomadura kijaniata TaxID=46161 RepID=UPI003F1D3A69
MGRDIHVTSKAISRAGNRLTTDVKPLVVKARNSVDKTSVDAPAFGLIGMGIWAGHNEIQNYTRNYLQAAAEALDRMDAKLQEVAKTWKDAEDKSTTKVQG